MLKTNKCKISFGEFTIKNIKLKQKLKNSKIFDNKLVILIDNFNYFNNIINIVYINI